MTFMDRIALFQPVDFAAVGLLFFLWIAIGYRVEHPSAKHLSTSMIMAGYRKEWMRQMVTREPRIFDAQILGTLRQGTAFFASTCVIGIGGCLALIGNAERLAGVAADITLMNHPEIVWELKIIVMTIFLTNAFLKFVWANRLFGYCSVLMAAVPNDPDHAEAYKRAEQAAHINITAAKGFNRGLRSIYFALASAAWLAGPIPLMLASVITVTVIWRREFASYSRKILLNP
ncbi:DUF599 domain-containing protein [Roseobacter sp. YSTF-M11]|uniref:DUF599 domain-containing protein n=1 Tax=Roseobacter insulae TaxID=2859783 RepID=A0A9X1FY59_9RHOB|nr:DUF599 domain-containing protein [Roseobacter insulae]MBW4709487.1 DUF599 domain-containing protein [Roseobacter insulae]